MILFRRCKKNSKGIALVLVLWVLVLLSVLAGEFCYSAKTEVGITRSFKEKTEAYYIAYAGMQRAILEIMDIESGVALQTPTPGVIRENDTSFVEWRINSDIPPIGFGNGYYKVYIGNESGKVNINKAEALIIKAMLNRFNLDETDKNVIVDSILDWRDEDNFYRINGAESDYYLSLPEPYKCKNGPFDSIQELLLVRGITPDIFYGGLKDLVTVGIFEYPKNKKEKSKRDIDFNYNQINLNAASRALLLDFAGMSDVAVDKIIDFRKKGDFKSFGDFLAVIGPENFGKISPFITFANLPIYTVRVEGRINGSKSMHSIEAVLEFDKFIKKNYRIVSWNDRWERSADRIFEEKWIDFSEQPRN